MSIIVCPLTQVETVVRARRPSHLITLLDPEHPDDWTEVDAYVEALGPVGLMPADHLRIGVHDISDEIEGMLRADEAMVSRVLAFGRGWSGGDALLVHCWAGISRSTATAYSLACEKNPEIREHDIAMELRRNSPTANPNRRIVALADDLLDRGGRMVDAVDAMGPAQPTVRAEPFEIRSRW